MLGEVGTILARHASDNRAAGYAVGYLGFRWDVAVGFWCWAVGKRGIAHGGYYTTDGTEKASGVSGGLIVPLAEPSGQRAGTPDRGKWRYWGGLDNCTDRGIIMKDK